MTILVAGVSVLLALVLSGFVVSVGGVAADRARAQLAADAAALAAVAESATYGHGDPETAARDFARINGARLVNCLCAAGATASQVTVAVGDVEARARAVFDPSRVAPVASAEGMHPVLASSLERLLAAADGVVSVVSGHRSSAEQASLWAEALETYGTAEAADDWVAKPGTSMHELGLAVDLGGDVERAARIVAELGLPLHRPLPNEPWHFELISH